MIIDAFTYCGEKEMLLFRLKMLAPLVDKFIIVESNYTFSGNPKPYYGYEHIRDDRFFPYQEKLIFFEEEADLNGLDFTKPPTEYDPSAACWQIERQQRNAIGDACKDFPSGSFVLMGDVDEIPSREAVEMLKNRLFPGIATFKMAFFYYNLTCLRNEIWSGTIWTPLDALRKFGAQKLRDSRGGTGFDVNNAGWHLSYFGGVEKIQRKIEGFSHQELATPEFLDAAHIEKCIADGTDLFKRGTPSVKVARDYFPEYFQENVTQEAWWG